MIVNGKKLLILGANYETIPLIKTAQKMGIYVIVTDNNPAAPAKKYADIPYNIDGMYVDGLVAMAKKEKIDGVIVGVADRLVVPYQKVCEKLNLPSYGTKHQCRVLSDKYLFNEYCEKFGITTIPSILVDSAFREAALSSLSYPVLVKPVDSNSGKGMSLCHDKQSLLNGIEKGMENSKSGRLLLERYMNCDDIFINYTIINGIPFLSAVADRFTQRDEFSVNRVCQGARYPSKHLELFRKKYHDKFARLFQTIGIVNAVFMISAFVENGEMYVYDPGFRLQGEAPDIHIKDLTGFDQKEFLIRIALGKIDDYTDEEIAKYSGESFTNNATIWILGKPGRIHRIEGLKALENDPNIIAINIRFKEGDKITSTMIGTEAQVISRIYLKARSIQSLKENITSIYETFRVYDEKDNSLVQEGFDVTAMG